MPGTARFQQAVNFRSGLSLRTPTLAPLRMQTDTAALAKAANEARGLAMDSIAKAHSGHLGLPLGCAEVLAVHMRTEISCFLVVCCLLIFVCCFRDRETDRRRSLRRLHAVQRQGPPVAQPRPLCAVRRTRFYVLVRLACAKRVRGNVRACVDERACVRVLMRERERVCVCVKQVRRGCVC
jgi:hypothetical protein